MVHEGNIIIQTFPPVETKREEALKMLEPLPKGRQKTAAAAIDKVIETALFTGYTQGVNDALNPEGAEILSRIMENWGKPPDKADNKRLS